VVVGLQRHIGGLVLCALSSGIAVAVHVFVNLVAGRWDPSLGTARLLLPSASERLEAAAAESQPAVVAEGEDCDSYFPSNKLFRRGVLDPEQVVAEVLAKCSAATLELTWEEENEEEVLTSGASE
jgi:hypothetical protein